ncbi:MAG: LPS assembly protein LptD [Nitrospirota bacterium]|nr:LPS assembly protein LptD [Nitrospirota bacterium]
MMRLVRLIRWPLVLWAGMCLFPIVAGAEAPSTTQQVNAENARGVPVEITADRIEYDQEREEYHAIGDVDVTRGPVRLTADDATLQKLTGQLLAVGHVHLRDGHADVWAEQLELNMNTEAGVLTTGKIFGQEQNSFVTGQRLQRFSETHYRVKEGSFTNCDAKDGQIPAWRFTFEDMDLDYEDSLFGKGVWFNINDVPVLPLPPFQYPLGAKRKSGLLIPTVGINNAFGFTYRQGYFWAINPSQDLTIAPQILTSRGYGGDLNYRYAWSREAKGQWFMNGLYDTEQNRKRFQFRGAHAQQFSPDLSFRMNLNYSTDRQFLQDLSNSGVQRALPSQESNLTLLQRLDHGALYLWGQYLQPLNAGGDTTFQRLPEVGHRFVNPGLLGSPLALTADTTAVHFWREEGFNVSRLDFLPGLSVEGLHVGHTVGIRPQVKFREVAYSRGLTDSSRQFRETYWVGAEAFSNVTKRFSFGELGSLRHSMKPNVIYEFVPQTRQSKLVQIDAVDDLINKSLLTYSLKNRVSRQGQDSASSTWLDLFLAQSYHVGDPPPLASKFSDIWTRGEFHQPLGAQNILSAFNVTVDAFFDHQKKEFTQLNTDGLIQGHRAWYLTAGQRYSKAGSRTRRGDIWNPISFNEVLAPAEKILFLTAGGGVRLPGGVTVGSRWYHDFRTGKTAELDVVALYQNPCRCFSVGLYYVRLPDREQYDFLISLTGLWGSQGNGTQLMQSILEPIMGGDRGVPWNYR